MIFRQILHPATGCASYVFGCTGRRALAVVDPHLEHVMDYVAVSDVAHPSWRASAVGVYRLWRDSGYAVGALLAGLLADLFGVPWAIAGVAALTFLSGAVVVARMDETLPTNLTRDV